MKPKAEDKVEDLDILVGDYLNYFKNMKGKNLWHYRKFQLCQILNIVMLAINWWVTNWLFDGNFSRYGVMVLWNRNSMSDTFPLKVIIISNFYLKFPNLLSTN